MKSRENASPDRMIFFAVLITFALVLVACGKEESSQAGCISGQTTSCACPGGLTGVQACTDDGRYGACECGDGVNHGGETDAGTDPEDAGIDDASPGQRNTCGGRDALRFDNTSAEPGDPCGPCDDGLLICNGPNSLRCLGASALNACSACGVLDGEPAASCGTCGQGEYICVDPGALECVGDTEINGCGGCSELDGEPLFVCTDTTGMRGIWHCATRESVVCVTPGQNACGGASPLDANPWTSCGSCGEGIHTCDGLDAVQCSEEHLNSCGGCDVLPGQPGQSCGDCGEVWECEDQGLVCRPRVNPCGGCNASDQTLGESCGDEQHYVCDGPEDVACLSDLVNLCGGHLALNETPGSACGACGDGLYICSTINRVTCVGASQPNSCGGCERLHHKPGAACGTCQGASWQCQANDPNTLECVGDEAVIDLDSDPLHCGFCRNRCSTLHPDALCVDGECEVELDSLAIVATGQNHTCASPGDGTVYCWGHNAHGAVTGSTANVSYHAPVKVNALGDVVQLTAGDHHSCALNGSGQVICWGLSSSGRLGPGITAPNSTFAAIEGLSDVIDIAAGGQHSCAV
ncbi:MAG: RCC1 domain-containing protein, partial [Bradymonadaceae bacterium]